MLKWDVGRGRRGDWCYGIFIPMPWIFAKTKSMKNKGKSFAPTYRYQNLHLELNHVQHTLYALRQSLLSFQYLHQRKYLKPVRRKERERKGMIRKLERHFALSLFAVEQLRPFKSNSYQITYNWHQCQHVILQIFAVILLHFLVYSY